MEKIKIILKDSSYEILIGGGILDQSGKFISSLKLGSDAIIVTNPVIKKLYGNILETSLKQRGMSSKFFEVPEGEKSKSAQVAFPLFNQIAAYDVGKKIFLIALGGGVVGDLGGFIASVYKRGIPYVQIPTTLLAQIDSSIGGKVAIDLPAGKNLVGSFYQPKLVLSDVNVLSSLSERQIRNGMAEAIKYGVIADKKLFKFIEKRFEEILQGDKSSLIKMISACSRIKADVVMKDEKETKGLRTILNFGHTLGHAIEAAGTYDQYQHGEAIALGMNMAAIISNRMKMLSDKNVARLKGLISECGLPTQLQNLKITRILEKMQHDKKFTAGKNRFVLAKDIGRVELVDGIPLPIIKEAIAACS